MENQPLAFVDPPFWWWGPVWAKFGKPGGSRLWPQIGRVPQHQRQPTAPDEPLASRFRLHRPTSARDVTVSIDLGMLTATPLSLLTPLRRRLQGGSQGGSGQRLDWGRLVYVQPVRCESAAGSSVHGWPVHRCRRPLPKRPEGGVSGLGACHADAVLTAPTHAVHVDAARCVVLRMLRDSCGGAGCTGEHTLKWRRTRHCGGALLVACTCSC